MANGSRVHKRMEGEATKESVVRESTAVDECVEDGEWRPYLRGHFVITSFTSGWQKCTNAISCCVRCT